jgi:hypothetical protein
VRAPVGPAKASGSTWNISRVRTCGDASRLSGGLAISRWGHLRLAETPGGGTCPEAKRCALWVQSAHRRRCSTWNVWRARSGHGPYLPLTRLAIRCPRRLGFGSSSGRSWGSPTRGNDAAFAWRNARFPPDVPRGTTVHGPTGMKTRNRLLTICRSHVRGVWGRDHLAGTLGIIDTRGTFHAPVGVRTHKPLLARLRFRVDDISDWGNPTAASEHSRHGTAAARARQERTARAAAVVPRGTSSRRGRRPARPRASGISKWPARVSLEGGVGRACWLWRHVPARNRE